VKIVARQELGLTLLEPLSGDFGPIATRLELSASLPKWSLIISPEPR
jgi:hypothetical protein